jgi:orotidine-5'-phosphate decarboxylase
MRAAVEAAGDMQVFVVTEMSHPGGGEFTAPLAERFAAMAREAGASGVIAPATRPERIAAVRRIVGSMLILSPGVGAQGGSVGKAIAMGADKVIVGRSIYEAADPRRSAEELVEEIRTSGNARP